MNNVDRILTTHVGSLPRPERLLDLMTTKDRGGDVADAVLDDAVVAAVNERMGNQVEVGIDVVSDGEMSKIGYATYIRHRLSGFEIGDVPRATPADLDAYPEFRDRLGRSGATVAYLRPICRGPITYEHFEPLERDIETLRQAVAGRPVAGAFMNAPSPGTVALFQPNEYYEDPDDYLQAIGEGMKHEYDRIIEAGFELQIDAPDLGMGRHNAYKHLSDDEFLKRATVHVEVLNNALRDVPADRSRMHVCWGNYEGPHTFDIGVDKVADLVLKAKPSTILCEAANPRHGHDWAFWADAKIPDDKVFAPGVIDTTTNFVEHPALVAERLFHFADIVGRDRVIASTDCGFGTFAGWGSIDIDVCLEKLRSLAQGAAMATEFLW